jgi:hypothetical protein
MQDKVLFSSTRLEAAADSKRSKAMVSTLLPKKEQAEVKTGFTFSPWRVVSYEHSRHCSSNPQSQQP